MSLPAYKLLYFPYKSNILSYNIHTRKGNNERYRRKFSKMGKEEQVEEREVLESIFPDEITGTNPPLPRHSRPSASAIHEIT